MWTIFEKKSLIKALSKIPKDTIRHYELWKRIIEHEGLQGLRFIKGFHDEALKGSWKDYRSSQLNKQWRVIYSVEKKQCEIYVIDINAHDYQRR